MYLSKIVLNPRSAAARRDLASPYELHATLSRAFAAPDERPPRFLWRSDTFRGRVALVLVQSVAELDWREVAQKEGFGGYFSEPPTAGPLPLQHLQSAQVLRFRLRANPTVTKKDPENLEKRKRHGLKGVEEQLEWLSRQGEKGGFTVLGAMVAQSERLKLFKHRGGPPITLQSALFEGNLKISDLAAFKATLESGIGHAKALGFGLLSVARGA